VTYAFAVLGAASILAGGLYALLRLDAAVIARSLRMAGPGLLGLAGVVLLLVGRAAIGGMLIAIALAWLGSSRVRPSVGRRKAPRRSHVRTAALEMELDHETGALEGLILAGRYEQRMLGSLGKVELLDLLGELRADPESCQLLETYLDGRFPGWRENAQPNGGDGQGVPPASGAMTKQEAYKILGLEAGASAADIRKAHRRLMQRLHPDLGGTSFLAARINEAKDVLLANHH
jgi:hypothetical protein